MSPFMRTWVLPSLVLAIGAAGCQSRDAKPAATQAPAIGSFVVPADLTLAPSTSTILPAANTLPIVIGPQRILAGQAMAPAVTLSNRAVAATDLPDGPNGYWIAPLRDQLATLRGDLGTPWVTVIADAATPYRLFTQVMYTAGEQGLKDVQLLVRGAGGQNAIPLHLPDFKDVPPRRRPLPRPLTKEEAARIAQEARKLKGVLRLLKQKELERNRPVEGTDPEPPPPLQLTVMVSADRIEVHAQGTARCPDQPCGIATLPKTADGYPIAKLAAEARVLLDQPVPGRKPGATVLVGLAPELPFELLVRVLDALRSDAHGALFPDPLLFVPL
jgi:hypothetical protein